MAKTIPSQRSVYIAATIVILVTALWAVFFLPRLDRQPEAIKDGAAGSSKTFFKLLLAAAVILFACVILSRFGGRIVSGIISGLLYLGSGLVLFHSFMVFDGASYYLGQYKGFSTEATGMLMTVVANLIAAILAMIAGNRYRKLAQPRADDPSDEREGSQ